MNDAELRAALDGLYAYDTGSVDSGIRDETLRSRYLDELRRKSAPERRAFVCQMIVDSWLSPDAQKQGYGPEDAASLIGWLGEQVPEAIYVTASDFA
jgi:hypothetical protein